MKAGHCSLCPWCHCNALLLALAPAQEKIRFPIGASSKTFSYGPLWLAQKLGYFEREGLDVQIVVMRGTPITLQALATDSIYAANAGTDGVISADDKGLDFAMVGSLLNNSEHEPGGCQAVQNFRRSARQDYRLANPHHGHRVSRCAWCCTRMGLNIRATTGFSMSAA